MLTEHEEQCLIFEYFEHINKPELRLLHSSLNGVRLKIGQAMKAKRSGMKKGLPDLFLPVPRKEYHGLYIELKRLKAGVVSTEQKWWIEQLNNQGYKAVVCKGHQEAIKEILYYLK